MLNTVICLQYQNVAVTKTRISQITSVSHYIGSYIVQFVSDV